MSHVLALSRVEGTLQLSLWKCRHERVAKSVRNWRLLGFGQVEWGCRLFTEVVGDAVFEAFGGQQDYYSSPWLVVGKRKELLAHGIKWSLDSSLLEKHRTTSWDTFQIALPTAPICPQIHTISTVSQASVENLASLVSI